MFEELFTNSVIVERYRAAPLPEPRERYLRHLAESGARHRTLRAMALDQVRLLHVLDLSEDQKVSIAQIEAIAPEWDRTRCKKPGRKRPTTPTSTKRSLNGLIRWLRFLGWLDEPGEDCRPCSVELGIFEEWMRCERGHSEGTISLRLRDAGQFVDWIAASGKRLETLQIADIDAAIEAKAARRRYSRVSIRMYATGVRKFLRFAEEHGWCKPGIAEGIVPGKFHPEQKVHSALNRADIRRVLATTHGERPADKRDRAILMLLIVYGLRAGEVRRLRLDDLDWENETLRVHRPKTGRTDLFPLSRSVGQAIVRYIRDVRPRHRERALFLTLRAPIRPLCASAPANIVRRRMDDAGIARSVRGAHALRHAAAQHLLDRGVSMKVIGDYLGHRDLRSTNAYARHDLNILREVAALDLEGLT